MSFKIGFLIIFKWQTQQEDHLIGVASHELKTPVTSIKAYAQILKRRFEKQGDDAAVQNLAKMEDQINKLNALIGDLLDVTKIETGKIVFNIQAFDFDRLVKVFQRFFRVTGKKGGNFPGLGLGLYIAMEIIKRHHGKMWLNSTVGKGSIFSFSIPAGKAPSGGADYK